MAARTTSRRGASSDPEAVDVAASATADAFDDGPREDGPGGALLEADDESEPDLDDEQDDDEDDLVGDPASDGEPAASNDDDDAAQETVATALVTPDAAFDDDDDQMVAVVGDDEDDDEEVEGLRDGEFVCRSCHLAMRDTQLADPESMICRDCV